MTAPNSSVFRASHAAKIEAPVLDLRLGWHFGGRVARKKRGTGFSQSNAQPRLKRHARLQNLA
jgi:hypothetical protein